MSLAFFNATIGGLLSNCLMYILHKILYQTDKNKPIYQTPPGNMAPPTIPTTLPGTFP